MAPNPPRAWVPAPTWSCCFGAAPRRRTETRRRRRKSTLWPRDSSDPPLPTFVPGGSSGTRGLLAAAAGSGGPAVARAGPRGHTATHRAWARDLVRRAGAQSWAALGWSRSGQREGSFSTGRQDRDARGLSAGPGVDCGAVGAGTWRGFVPGQSFPGEQTCFRLVNKGRSALWPPRVACRCGRREGRSRPGLAPFSAWGLLQVTGHSPGPPHRVTCAPDGAPGPCLAAQAHLQAGTQLMCSESRIPGT